MNRPSVTPGHAQHLDRELERFAELLRAFEELAAGSPDLQLRGSASPPPLGFALRLQPEPTSAGAELCLWMDGGKLSTWSDDGHHPLRGHEDRYVHLDLDAGFVLGAEDYGDARELAGALLGWMQREIAGAQRRSSLEVL